MGVRIDGSNDVVSAADGSLTVDGLSLSVTGIITASGGFKVGSAYTAFSNGNVETTGIVTTSGGLNVTDGNVGIGTNIAGTLLELNGKSSKEATVTFNRQPVQGTNDGTIGEFMFENATDSVALLAVKRQSAADDAYFQFATQATGGGLTEKLRINSSGQVLIGATSAETSHDDRVQINSTTGVAVHRGAASVAGPRVDLTKSRNTTYTSNTIVQSGDLLGSIFFRGDDGTDYNSAGAQIFAAVDGTPGANDMPGRLVLATTSDGNNSATERLRIDAGGRLITGNYSTALDTTAGSIIINGDSSGGRIAQRGSGSSANTTLGEMFGYWDTNKVAGFQFTGGSDTSNKDDGQIKIYTSASGPSLAERIRINAAGNVRIGSFGAPSNKNSVTPLSHVDGSGVNGGFQVNRHTSVGGGGAQLLLSATRGSSITGHTVLQSGDGIGTVDFLGSDGDEFVPAASIQAQVDGTPGNNDMPGRLIFKTTADGASGPTERMRILSSGGLTFNGDTATANALNDYEEGTWTPTAVNFDGTITINSADYVKVGRLVHVNMYISFSNTTDTSNVLIGGLPFTVAEQDNHYSLLTAHSNGNIPDLAMRAQGTTTQLTAVYLNNSDGDSKPNYNHVRGQFIIAGGTYYST